MKDTAKTVEAPAPSPLTPPPPPPPRWEYYTLVIRPYLGEGDLVDAGRRFNDLGADGWELVGFRTPTIAVFKRRLP